MIDERSYLAVLHEELVPAQGCTEPIALAYCSAQARKALGTDPENIRVLASGNIIKNVKSVVVPGTNGRRGIETAAVFGALAGDPEKKLEVLTGMPADRCRMAEEFLEHPEKCTVEHLKTDAKLHMIVEVCGGGHVVRAELKDRHTNIVRIEKDGEDIFRACPAESLQEHYTDRSFMRLTDILRFAETVDIEKVRDCIERQIALQRGHLQRRPDPCLRLQCGQNAAGDLRHGSVDPDQGCGRGGLRRPDERFAAAGGHQFRLR